MALQPAVAQASVDATITVGATRGAIPSNYLGFNLEMNATCSLLQDDAAHPAYFEGLFKALGAGVLHINGNSADTAQWQPTGTFSCGSPVIVTQALVDQVFSFARSIGWKVIWGLNLVSDNPAMAASEAAYVASSGGSTLTAFNIGNEPEAYVRKGYRPVGWGYSNYLSEWRSEKSAVLKAVSSARLTAPDMGDGTPWYGYFAASEKGDASLTALSHHFYIGGSGTITSLLAKSTLDSFSSKVATWKATADADGLPFYLSEMNTYYSGGVPGVSNTLAAAMWLCDALLKSSYQGVRQADIQQARGSVYNALNLKTGQPNAPYYGLRLFHAVAQGGTFRAVTLSTSHNLDAYAISGPSGVLRVVILNKDTTSAVVSISTPTSYASASYYAMSGSSLSATSVTLTGTTVVPMSGSSLQITAPAGSVLAITLTPGS